MPGVIESAGLDFIIDDAEQAPGLGDRGRCVAPGYGFPAFLPLVLKIDSHGIAASFDATHVNP